jgi:hypothetical protein
LAIKRAIRRQAAMQDSQSIELPQQQRAIGTRR